MRYLTSLIVGLCLLGIVAFMFLDARSRDSSLWAYRHAFSPETRRMDERYLQFSGTPGVLLLGVKITQVTNSFDPRDLAEPWKVELKPFPKDIDKIRSAKREGDPLRTTLGVHLRTHGSEETAFFARYLFISCPWMIAHLCAIIMAQLGLHWWLKRRATSRVQDKVSTSSPVPHAPSPG